MSNHPGFRTFEVSDPQLERDDLRFVTFKSPALGRRADMALFVPPEVADGEVLPVVLLLHGVYGSFWVWCFKGGAHLAAASLIAEGAIPPMILAMPSDGLWGDGSGYLPHRDHDYERFVMEDVVRAVREASPFATEASPLFISGLSMGGYGALRLGGKFPERFAGVSAHSAMTAASQHAFFIEEPLDAFGDPDAAELTVLHQLERNRGRLPPTRFDCGTDDFLLEANRELHRELAARDVPHEYAEFPGGHDWTYWRTHVHDSLRFFASILRSRS